MSNHLYLRCVTHEPYIQSEEVGHNLSYLPEIRRDIQNKDEWLKAWALMSWDLDAGSRSRTVLVRFLAEHPECDLEIWDEYGRQYPLVPEDEETPDAWSGVQSPLGVVKSVTSDEHGMTLVLTDLTDEGRRFLLLEGN